MSADAFTYRDCPYCSHSIRSAATLCGYCWKRVVPVDEDGQPLATYVAPDLNQRWWRFWK